MKEGEAFDLGYDRGAAAALRSFAETVRENVDEVNEATNPAEEIAKLAILVAEDIETGELLERRDGRAAARRRARVKS